MRKTAQSGRIGFALAALAIAALSSVEARAQAEPQLVTNTVGLLGGAQSGYCVVQKSGALKINIGDDEALVARCGVYTIPLGRAETFKVFANKDTEAVLVDLRNPQSRRLIMISRQDDGQPLTEDISGQISLSAGRGPLSSIANLDVDLTAFEKDGTIGVGAPATKDRSARTSRIDLKRQVEGLRAAGFKFSAKNK